MARNGSGTMSIPNPDFVPGATISSSEVDANFATIVNEITNSIAADGQTTPTADLPMGGFHLTGMAAGSDATDSVHLRQVQAQAYIWCGTAGGTADAITLSPSPSIAAYAAGQSFRFIAASNNTDAVTIAVSGLSNRAAQNDGAALTADEIVAGSMYEVIDDGTQYQIRLVALFSLDGLGISAFAQTILDDADAGTVRTTLGLGTSSTVDTGTSGATIPLLNANNTHSGNLIVSGTLTGSSTVSFTSGATVTGAALAVGTPTGSPSAGEVNASGGYKINDAAIIERFSSSTQAFNDDATLTFAHGLSATPDIVLVWLVNTTTDLGYSVSEQVAALTFHHETNAAGWSVSADGTNVSVTIGDALFLHSKADFNDAAIDEGDWTVKVVALVFVGT